MHTPRAMMWAPWGSQRRIQGCADATFRLLVKEESRSEVDPKEAQMGKVILSEFVTLDGVMQDPGGGEEFEHGGWQVPFFDDEDINTVAQEILSESDALLLGRVTYEQFAQVWPTITDEQGFAERMNTMPKYVASTTLTEPLQWNASLIQGDVAEEVAKLKRDRNLLVNGSGKLTQTLLRHALVDDFRIWIHPVVLGDGERLFTDGGETTAMKLRDTRVTSAGVVVLSLLAST
jgi:dihydrofolate reductase